MRFLFLSHNHPGCGTFFRAFQLGKHLALKKHHVTLMVVSQQSATKPKKYKREGVWIVECPHLQGIIQDKEDGWGPLDNILRIIHGITHPVDIVAGFGHKPDIAIPSLFLKHVFGTPLITDWCDLWGQGGIFSVRGLLKPQKWGTVLDRQLVRFETFLERYTVQKASGVTVICSFLKESARKMGVKEHDLLLLRSGCDTKAIVPQDKAACRRKLSLPEGKIVAYLGNYHQEAAFLFNAFGRLVHKRTDISLMVIGPSYPLPLTPDIAGPTKGERIYRDLPLETKKRVIWAGKQPFSKLSVFLSAADALLIPMENSLLEQSRWPNKTCDYLASGRPVIATDVGDVGVFLREHKCGVVSAPDIDAYCEALLKHIDDENHLSEMGLKARAVAETVLSWERIAGIFLEFVLQKMG
jgi:glycosyltransferase involved in cell wall biosynthesis